MAIQKILTVPSPILRQKSKPVGKISARGGPAFGWKKIVQDLIETVKSAKEPKGVGLSAPQIGKLVRIFVVKQKNKFTPFINPKITWRSKKMMSQALEKERGFLEGCLSLPPFYGFVDRAYKVKVSWQDLKGKFHQEEFTSKESAYIQHEVDHLEGILFIDRILEQKGKIYQLEKDKEGKELFVEIKIP